MSLASVLFSLGKKLISLVVNQEGFAVLTLLHCSRALNAEVTKVAFAIEVRSELALFGVCEVADVL